MHVIMYVALLFFFITSFLTVSRDEIRMWAHL